MKKQFLFLIACSCMALTTAAQNVAINMTGEVGDSTAMFDVQSSTKGMLIPRLTTAGRDSILNPANGLLIFNKQTGCINYFSTTWHTLCEQSATTTQVPIIRTYTSNATWTKPPNLKYIIVEMVGGGGGGGGCYNYGGGSGAGGGYSKKLITASSLASTVSITIGIGGSGGSPQNSGVNGGTTSFGSYCYATGGEGGVGQNSINYSSVGSAPGIGIGGDINLSGQGSGGVTGSAETRYCGGSSVFGGGALSNGSYSGGDGFNATSYGAGGSGASGYNTSNRTGGNGSSGIVIITEYY